MSLQSFVHNKPDMIYPTNTLMVASGMHQQKSQEHRHPFHW